VRVKCRNLYNINLFDVHTLNAKCSVGENFPYCIPAEKFRGVAFLKNNKRYLPP